MTAISGGGGGDGGGPAVHHTGAGDHVLQRVLEDVGHRLGQVEGHAFPHGLGHMIGLDVHDMENLGEEFVGYGPGFTRSTQFGLGHLRLARTLEPGFALTVEPGLYFIPALIDRWKADGTNAEFLNFTEIEKFRDARGYRVEDDVVVTETGCRVLGPGIPKTVADVEAACRG